MKRFVTFLACWVVFTGTAPADVEPQNLEAAPFFATVTLHTLPSGSDSLLVSVVTAEVITLPSSSRVPKHVTTTFALPLDKVQLIRSTGQPVEPSAYKAMVAEERVVVVSADGRLPAARYRRLLSKDSLILVIDLAFLPRSEQTVHAPSPGSDTVSIKQRELQMRSIERMYERGLITHAALARAKADLEAARRLDK